MTKSKEITLGESCDISRIETVYQGIREAIDSHGEIIISASSVEKIDASFIQLLVSISKYAKVNGVNVKVVNPSQNFIHAARLTGTEKLLGM